MTTYFQGIQSKPYHLSIGAVLVNKKGEIACHHFLSFPSIDGEFYILMRETIEPNETIEETLKRGLMEEFGATGKLRTYIGSSVAHFPSGDAQIQKTTLYFLMDLESMHIKKRDPNDPEAGSSIEWHTPEFLIEQMQKQFARLQKEDLNEVSIVERAQKFI